MELSVDQQLRKDLLALALGVQSEVEAAIAMAARMESFVLQGQSPDAADKAASAASNGGNDTSRVSACSHEHKDQATADQGTPEVLRKRRWSANDDADLGRLWHSTLSLEEIAERLDRTVPSLYSRARALGYGRRDQEASTGSAADPEQAAVMPEGEEEPQVAPAEHVTAAEHLTPAQQAGGKSVMTSDAAAVTPAKTPCGEKTTDRYRTPRFGGAKRPGRGWRPAPKGPGGLSRASSALPGGGMGAELGVEPIVQFLRSRDYSVVRVEDGRFRVDGRRVMDVDQLRDKANNVRESLGLPPFVREFIEAAE